MSNDEIHKQIQFLQSPDLMQRLRATNTLGKMGARLGMYDEESEALALSAGSDDAIMALAEALRDPESSLIRAEAAWAMGRIGGVAAMGHLLYRLEEIFQPQVGAEVLGEEDREQDNVRASLIAAAGKGFSEKVLQELDEDNVCRLAQQQKIMLEKIQEESNENVRVAMIEALVALAVRAAKAKVALQTDLTDLLCDTGSVAVLASIALLKETDPDAQEVAARWHNRAGSQEPDQKVESLLEKWRQQLGECCPDREKLLEWLDTAAVIWDLREAAQVI